MIRNVIVYSGHKMHPLLGPYEANVTKQFDMFNLLNPYRERLGKLPWKVTCVPGEQLIEELKKTNPKETLLVIPAGQSSYLDKVFSAAQTTFIRNQFLAEGGGHLYGTCGASYTMSLIREYNGLSAQHPDKRETSIKHSLFPIFEGTAKGPLCPFPGAKYQVGFYSDAVKVTDGTEQCTIYLSGGGSFFLHRNEQKVKVLVKYLDSELLRLGKTEGNWENATILAQVGKGAALLSMFHPYYGPHDIDVEAYERTFPDAGTNWRRLRDNLSPLDQRMRFVLHSMLLPLENFSGDM